MRSSQRFLVGLLGAGLAVTGLTLTPAPAEAASSGLVINEIYGGGGATSGSPYSRADFVELYNPTGGTVSTAGLSLQYRSSGFTTGTPAVLPLPSADIPSHAHYLVQVSSGSYGPALPVTPDFTATSTVLNMAATNGQVILAQGTTPITATGTGMQAVANVVDFVGYGTATSSETAPTGTSLDNTRSVQRLTGADSDNNQTDFGAPGAPTPTAAPAGPLTATDPADVTTYVDQPIAPIQLEASGGSAPYTWQTTALPAGLTLTGSHIDGTPTATGTTEVTATVTDAASPAATDSVTFTITVRTAPVVVPIAEIQGTAAESPMVGDTVTTEGVVTAMYKDPSFAASSFDGMYVQTAGTGGTTDATEGASDAVYVYGSNAMPAGVQVGDSVRVTGPVSEFQGTTEITPASGGVEEVAALAPVTGLQIAYPTTEAGREAQEGMLLAPTDPFTVTNSYSTNTYGEVGLATGSSPLRQPTELADADDTAGLQAIKDDNAARGVVLDDGTSVNYLTNSAAKNQPLPWLTAAGGGPNAIRVGAAATLHQPVVLEYRFNTWRFQPRTPVYGNGDAVATFQDTRAGNLAPGDVGGDIQIATFNVLNFFNTTGEQYVANGAAQNPPVNTQCTYYDDRAGNHIADNTCGVVTNGVNAGNGPRGAATQVSFERQRAKIVTAINALGADIVGLQEVENSLKLVGETDRDDALRSLVQALNAAAGAGTWRFVHSPGEATTSTNVALQDVIRPAFIYKPAAVRPVGQSDIYFEQSATGQPFANAREPLAQAFKAAGALDSDAFAVVLNHFKSKGDSNPPATGDNASGEQGAFNGDRVRQATKLAEFAEAFAAARDIDAVFLAGDFNSYSQEDPMQVLYGAGYDPIESSTPGEETYSYSGLSGSLDHVLGNAAAMAMVTGADVWDINAAESAAFQYSRFNYNVTDFWQPNLPFAASDHNPEIFGIDVPDATPGHTDVQIIGTNDFHGRLLADGTNAAGAAVLSGAVKELREENPNTVFAAAGDLIGASTFESFIQNDEPTIEALNEAGLEVSAAGNHEFDQGYEDFVGRVQDHASWEYIAANVVEPPGRDDLAETWTTTVGGKKIGFVGAVTEDLPSLVSPAGIEGVSVTDIVDATNAAAADLTAQGADLVILLVHEGSPQASCTDPSFTDDTTTWGNIVQNVSSDVDAIISGHTHLLYNCRYPVQDWVDEGREVTQRPVVSAGQYGTNLDQLVFTFDDATGDLVGVSQDSIGLVGTGFQSDPVVADIVAQAKAQADVLGSQVLGQIEAPFNRAKLSSGTENRGGESTLGNLVAEVQRWATRNPESGSAQIAFMNPGGLRADLTGTVNGGARDVTYKQAAVVQPFANTLVNMDLTGANIKLALEQQWQRDGSGNVPSRPFLRLGVSKGFTYTFDASRPEGDRITGMWLDGDAIDPAATYSVTVNSFLASGGDNFRAFTNGAHKADTGKIDLSAMVDYLAAHASSSPLPVDYSQRAVGVTLPAGAPATYHPGDHVVLDVSSWTMSTPDDVKDDEVRVVLGGSVIGTAPLDNTIGTAVFDDYGTAHVDVVLPADAPTGDVHLVLSGARTGTEAVVPITVAHPSFETVAPSTISGTAKIGKTLTGTPATFSPAPATVSYQWLADGVAIPGATSRTLKLGKAQLGKRITFRTTATAPGYDTATSTSDPTAPVAKGSGKD